MKKKRGRPRKKPDDVNKLIQSDKFIATAFESLVGCKQFQRFCYDQIERRLSEHYRGHEKELTRDLFLAAKQRSLENVGRFVIAEKVSMAVKFAKYLNNHKRSDQENETRLAVIKRAYKKRKSVNDNYSRRYRFEAREG